MTEIAPRPEFVPLCREDDDGTKHQAGWLFVMPDEVVAYTSARAVLNRFPSITDAQRLLYYHGLYVADDL